jgi:mannose-6-phosphate isomerase
VERIRRLAGTIQHYAWGSRHRLAALQGRPSPTPEPEAELWFGAHPLAPALVESDAGPVPLDAWIARDPERALGPRVVRRFGARLPFLAKLLAVERPLSIQVHPDAQRAREGFEREDRAGIPLDAPHRCYRDRSGKPELVCAIERLTVLHGFRPIGEVAKHLEAIGAAGLLPGFRELAGRPEAGTWRAVFGELLALAPERRRPLVAEAAERAHRAGCEPGALDWVARLARAFPDDVGVLAPLLLRLVVLEPGEALLVSPGVVHCYLEGFAFEAMASSDNVLRGGLTPKHVDRDELLRAGCFAPEALGPWKPGGASARERRYPVGPEEFALSLLELEQGARFDSGPRAGAEVLVCASGSVRVRGAANGGAVDLGGGAAAWIPAAAGAYQVTGGGLVHRVRVPLGEGERA